MPEWFWITLAALIACFAAAVLIWHFAVRKGNCCDSAHCSGDCQSCSHGGRRHIRRRCKKHRN